MNPNSTQPIRQRNSDGGEVLITMTQVSPPKSVAHRAVENGYTIQPSTNGGFTLASPNGRDFAPNVAAFSNSKDLLAFLTEGHTEVAAAAKKAARG